MGDCVKSLAETFLPFSERRHRNTALDSTAAHRKLCDDRVRMRWLFPLIITPLSCIRTSPSLDVPCIRDRKAWSKARNVIFSDHNGQITRTHVALNTVFPVFRCSTKSLNVLVGNSFRYPAICSWNTYWWVSSLSNINCLALRTLISMCFQSI